MSSGFTHQYTIAADNPCFQGHFPGFPVFPAVAQFSLLADALTAYHGCKCEITGIPVAKFLSPISPDTGISVELLNGTEGTADFRISSAGTTIAKGRLTYKMVES